MSETKQKTDDSRRDFLKQSAAAGVALGGLAVPRGVHADGNGTETLRVGLVGCGGRGSSAAKDALLADPNTELVAIADTFADHAAICARKLKRDRQVGDRVKLSADTIHPSTQRSFDGFKHVIDNVDVVLLATPPHFRPEHLAYAVEKGRHCFVEKPVGVDAPGIRSVQETCEKAKEKGLSIVSGLCWRYDLGVRETMQRIRDGAIGDIVGIESAYNAGTLWLRDAKPDWSRAEYQIRNWLYYTWLSGDHIVEQAIHSLDKVAWLLDDASPERAVGMGGRQQRTQPEYGNIYDHHTVFYRFADNIPAYFTCRQQANCTNHVDELVLGTKGQARIIANTITGETNWKYDGPKPSMYQVEHDEFFQSIRRGEPINNGPYMCNSSMLAIMGRMCTYTGQELTWEQAIGSGERLGPTSYEWGDLPEPPVAVPGVTEFA